MLVHLKPGMIPEGDDLLYCINNDIPICPECGAIMQRYSDTNGGCDIYECPECGFSIDEMDYEYHDPDDPDDEPGDYDYWS